MKTAWIGVAVLVVVAGCWKTRPNPEYCGGDMGCPTSMTCIDGDKCAPAADLAMPDLTPMCSGSTGCDDVAKPICDPEMSTCRACQTGECGDQKCATTGTMAGQCVECLVETDCSGQQFCDTTTDKCRACTANTDCGSKICDTGKCVLETDIAHVDNNASGCAMGDGTVTKPYCQVSNALGATNPKAYVLVAGSGTPYSYINIPATSGVTVTIVGPGRIPTPTAAFVASIGGAVFVSPSGGSANVTVDGVELKGSDTKEGAYCAAGGGAATLTIRDSYIHASGVAGVSSSGCTLTLERNNITENSGGGVILTSSPFTIENNFVVQNKSGTSAAVTIDGPSTGTFRFNTLARNGNTGGTAGITCGLSQSVTDSILIPSVGVTAPQTVGCTLTNVATGGSDGVTGDLATPPTFVDPVMDFHLKPGDSNNMACCVDKITGTGLPTVDVDNTPRPKGAGYDIGAHEVQ